MIDFLQMSDHLKSERPVFVIMPVALADILEAAGAVYKADHTAIRACNGCFYFVVSFSWCAVKLVCFNCIFLYPQLTLQREACLKSQPPCRKDHFSEKAAWFLSLYKREKKK